MIFFWIYISGVVLAYLSVNKKHLQMIERSEWTTVDEVANVFVSLLWPVFLVLLIVIFIYIVGLETWRKIGG